MLCVQANTKNSTGCVSLDVNLLKPSRVEFLQEPSCSLTVSDGSASSQTWLEYVYRTAHPALRWLPTKLAEWIGENLQDKLGFPDKADTRAAAGTGLGEILVMGLGLGWSFGRGKPRLGGLSIVQTHERHDAAASEARRKRAAEPKRVRKTAPA